MSSVFPLKASLHPVNRLMVTGLKTHVVMRHWFLTLICVWTAPSLCGQENAAQRDDIQAEEIPFALAVNERLKRNKFGLTEKVQRELALLQDFTKLSDEAVSQLLLELKPLIQSTYEEHSELIGLRIPPDQILDVLIESAKPVVSDQQLLAQYRADRDARLMFAKKMAMQSYVYHVDSYVGLNAGQWEAVRQICEKLYRQGDIRRRWVDSPETEAEREQLKRDLSQARNFAIFRSSNQSGPAEMVRRISPL